MPEILFYSLGGQDERGKNMFVVDVDRQLFIFDAGIKFPEKSALGIDVVMPNIEWLKENEKRIKGIFISNPSVINAGCVNIILHSMNISVYCNTTIINILKLKAAKNRIKIKEDNFKIINDKDIISFGNIKLEVFKTTSSFPDSYGFAVHTDDGVIVYAGDYIIDGGEQSYYSTDMGHLSKIAANGVLALISDSEYASRLDYTVPHHKIDKYISAPMKDLKKRVIIAILEEDIYKLTEVAKQAKENNRKMSVYGRTLAKVLESEMMLKNLELEHKDIISIDEFVASKDGILIITGTGDALYTRLTKIATGNDENITFAENDVVILATPPAAGVEKRHAQVLDELARTDAKIISLSDRAIWSMRASYEDIKLMTKIMKPKAFIPIKGLFKDLLYAERAAKEAGVPEGNTIVIDNGQILSITKEGKLLVKESTIKTGNVYVDGFGIGDVGAVVLNERKQLATDGVIIIGINIDAKTKEIISLIDTQMRGVIYIRDDNPIFKTMQKQITQILEKNRDTFINNPNAYDLNETKREIISKTRNLVKKDAGKQPIVLTIINEIEGSYYEPRKYQKKQK